MANTDVKEMITLCKSLGLRVQYESGLNHYSVRDPVSTAKLFYISSSPSDTNFKYNIARHLRRIGLLKGSLKFGKYKVHTKRKNVGAYDLKALALAQAQAESAGERIPLLEDIEGNAEFFQHLRSAKIDKGYTEEGIQEAIDNMAMKLTPRGNATKQRLRKTLEEKGIKQKEFVDLAMQVGQERDLRTWPSIATGQSILNKFIRNDEITLQLWGFNLIEATLDKIDGLQWGKTRVPEGSIEEHYPLEKTGVHIPGTDTPEYITEETLLNILGNWVPKIEASIMEKIQEDVFEGAPSNGDDLRQRYANSLLDLLNSNSVGDLDIVMRRLDKLIGLDLE